MSKKEQNAGGGNVTAMPDRCLAEGCNKGQSKLAFCEEHFVWYKEGLVNKKGERPSDFDRKYALFMRKKAA
ncbi:MAG: hypothetical protein AABZ31_02075 [Bdellovibrionota bacterium]